MKPVKPILGVTMLLTQSAQTNAP
ncbi:hypothetical protein TCAL_11526 [Tigriopus californicus]|uniref:Uncharacterized protein n=1 Tax=Tigriopus californicus TaxID=6832 RepID=A0A553P7C9_TIGCA|nr:hypothetical protein TCAL_11526 [Tigriopus californicus]